MLGVRVSRAGGLSALALCLLAWAEPASAQPADWDSLIREGDAALARDDYETAAERLEAAVAYGEGSPDQDPRKARSLVLLARVHRAEGDLAKPEDLYRQADPAATAAWGRESAEYASFLDEVGRYYHRRRKYTEAERFYLDAFGIRVRVLGREHVDVAASIANLAILYENLARAQKAESYYRTALDIRSRLLGDEHVKTVEVVEHFARFLHGIQRHEEAVGLEQRSRAARQPMLDRLGGEAVSLDAVPLSQVSRAPRVESQVEPEYTEEARLGRHQGSVAVRLEIDSEGVPRNLRVAQPLGLGLDERALEAVSQWRFRPARVNGRAVACAVTYEINFSLL